MIRPDTTVDKPGNAVYRFGPFRYDAEQRLLFRDGVLVPLLPKVADTLAALIEGRGKVIDKAELMRRVWPDTVVEEVGLARNVSLLRKALGEDEADTYIETIPRRGYRFVAEIRGEGEPEPVHARRGGRRWWIVGVAALLAAGVYWQFYRPSRYLPAGRGYAAIAVVPFECLSPEIGCGTFSKGFAEVLGAELTKQPEVRVLSPSTVQRYQRARISMNWMARLLGLDVLLEGTAEKVGERVRITARLADVTSGKLIWAQTYDYPAAELDRAQAETARAVAQQVGLRLGATPPSR